jgi:hypothetical protein
MPHGHNPWFGLALAAARRWLPPAKEKNMRNRQRQINITLEDHRRLSAELRQAAWHTREALRILCGKRGMARVGDKLSGFMWWLSQCTIRLERALLKEHPEARGLGVYDWGLTRLGPRPQSSQSVEHQDCNVSEPQLTYQTKPDFFVVGSDDDRTDMVAKYGKPR